MITPRDHLLACKAIDMTLSVGDLRIPPKDKTVWRLKYAAHYAAATSQIIYPCGGYDPPFKARTDNGQKR